MKEEEEEEEEGPELKLMVNINFYLFLPQMLGCRGEGMRFGGIDCLRR